MANEAELRAVFSGMEKRFEKGALDRDLSFYFSLGDGPGEKWTVLAGPERCEVKEGKAVENASCVLKTSGDMFLKIVQKGYTPGVMDFSLGKIKSNDPMLLKELKRAFRF